MKGKIYDSFKIANKNDWIEAAKLELKGKNPIDELTSSWSKLTQHPYYDQSDVEDATKFSLPLAVDPYLGPRGWYNMPLVHVESVRSANKDALAHLKNGADGILFRITEPVDLKLLLNTIELPFCNTYFEIEDGQYSILPDFQAYVTSNGYDPATISGGFIWNKFPPEWYQHLKQFAGWKKFHACGVKVVYQPDPCQEIASALNTAYSEVNKAIEKNIDASVVLGQIAFSMSLGTQFFNDVIRLKSLRQLWTQILGAHESIDPDKPLYVHAISDRWEKKEVGPNENMIKSTFAGLGGILGGCNGLTIVPSEGNELDRRIARNVGVILREESMLHVTADPVAGSYYIEKMVDELSKQSWKMFQDHWSR